MVGNVVANKLISISRSVSVLLFSFMLLMSTAVMAIQIGGADDPCASTSDPKSCYKTMAAGLSGSPGLGSTTSGSNQIKANDTGSLPQISVPPQAAPQQQDQSQQTSPSEFQTFIATSVGSILPKYGYNLFVDVPDTFAPLDNIPVTPDYLIGPGDEVVIKGWGQVDIDVRAVVNRNGEISIPKVGVINVAGIRSQELQSHIKASIGKVFRHFELNVSLGRLRTIQVFVVGQAKRPGVYTVSSLSTLVNTLFASGGPSLTGSLRHIQVKRDGKLVTELDLYDLLLSGDKSKDAALLPGDVIYIPPVGQQVAIYGSIKNPAIYELKDDKTTLADLLALAGGMTPTAAGQKVLLERIQDRKVRQVEEFPLDNDGLSRPMKDGDLVKVFPIEPRFDNAVTLRGNVATPGRYPWKEDMRVKDLIPNMDSLIIPGYWLKQNQSDRVKIVGEVQLQSEIKRATAEINLDYATVERLNKVDLTSKLLTFNLGKAIEGKGDQNLLLQPGDTITIFSKDDIQVPIADRSVYVRLEGEVVNAGVYKTLPGETLRQVLTRVGGLTPNAYLYGAEYMQTYTDSFPWNVTKYVGSGYRNWSYPQGFTNGGRWIGSSFGGDARILTLGWLDAAASRELKVYFGETSTALGSYDPNTNATGNLIGPHGRLSGFSAKQSFNMHAWAITPELDYIHLADGQSIGVNKTRDISAAVTFSRSLGPD